MAHRNRWFTELKNGGSFHGYVSHNQMVKSDEQILLPVHPTFCQGARDDSHPAEFQSIAAKVGLKL